MARFAFLLGLFLILVMSIGVRSEVWAHEGDCPADHFVDASGNPNVVLEVTCEGDSLVIVSNNQPYYSVPGNAQASETIYTWYIPLEPQVAPEPIEIPRLDPIAIAVDGVVIDGPNGADFNDYHDPVYEGILVECGGHHNPMGFHHHAEPDCLYADLVENPSDHAQLVGVVLGYAFDGYPILSPYVCANADCTEVSKVESSWERVQDVVNAWEANEYVAGSGDLDRCNGMTLPDGSYAYFATETFPYLLGCYHGVPDERSLAQARPQMGQGGQPPQGGQGQPPQNGQGGQPPRPQP